MAQNTYSANPKDYVNKDIIGLEDGNKIPSTFDAPSIIDAIQMDEKYLITLLTNMLKSIGLNNDGTLPSGFDSNSIIEKITNGEVSSGYSEEDYTPEVQNQDNGGE